MTIRLATEKDAAPILEIYAPFIEHTSITFETDVPTIPEFKNRINKYLETRPWLVAEINGKIAGYAYAGPYRERTAYQWCCESSVYIHHKYYKQKVAETLYKKLLEILQIQGYRNVYAVINLPNAKSVAFHEKMGFEYFASYPNVGYKLGLWKTVGWWNYKMNVYNNEPEVPIAFSKLAPENYSHILGK
jgi:L-amino acid N-acyltransferase YncA